jgi:hypothetical protein
MDKYTGAQNIVPFTEVINEVSLTVHGTHYMHWQLPLIVAYSMCMIHQRKVYVAISRATVLKIKFNTDEEI